MELKLNEDFIEKIAEAETFKQMHAALWIISGIKPVKWRGNFPAIKKISKFSNHDIHCLNIYKLGYVQALLDLELPLEFDNKPPATQELLGRGFDVLGINVLGDKAVRA